MKNYNFVLAFSLRDSDDNSENYIEALGENGCTDASVGMGRLGRISLDFTREAQSATEAIFSAITDVERSIPNAKLTRIEPDLVGITDVSNLVDRSRQNIRKLILAEGSECPVAIHSGNPTLWHLNDILRWLQQSKGYQISQELIEVAEIAKSLNALKVWNEVNPNRQKQAESMAALNYLRSTALPA